MDKQFLEFWGNMMLSASRGQQQVEDIMKWFSGNFREFSEITASFCRMYGIDPAAEHTPDYAALWQKAFNEFKDSFNELVTMMDLIPRKDYISLARENEDLKKRVAELEEAVRHFRAMLEERVVVPGGGIKGFQELINEQARQYQSFMKSVTAVFDERSKTAGTQHEPAAGPVEERAGKAKVKPKKKPAAGRK